MIDTHSHILPELDDGCETIEQSMNFIAQAINQGVRVMFATPHCCDGVYDCTKKEILAAWRFLCETVERQGLDIQILPGAEIRVNHDLVARYDAGDLLTLGDTSRFLLLELPPMFIMNAFLRMVRQLTERGIIPIIAHAERNPMIIARPELAAELISTGAEIQITAGSLKGDFGRAPRKTAKILVQNNQVFCLGSDIHPGRKYRMKAAEKFLNKAGSIVQTEKIVQKNPEKILKECVDQFIYDTLIVE
ncbi:tyrosine-protein phosphatase [Desulfobacter latus]|uniref:protein-tyrosine-phosphatase n=1 Tax=Desulfobacter latus TaxID=2292 RepID=A0A850T5V0_9BACT|nr:CpsB/CapC family capsule biosynthesis tyrosine phosphatase [Desulfobacter latus]NWH04315.1 tyrosine protein phosphatase [Desulfobacter latus]